ncbi:hypothetical protein O0L34_g1159 [Tuta absoluta]|nr:hypothetical protein O0L34_g1159 [Tuta absoluta]
MWLLVFLCVISGAFQRVYSQNDPLVFQKCCKLDQSLVKVEKFNSTDFFCVDSDSAKKDYNITQFSHLVVFNNVSVHDGIPSNCSLKEVIVLNEMDLIQITEVCYDKKIAEISNGTVQNIPQMIALLCNEPENDTRPVHEFKRFRKCCPEGQAYDTKHHTCRDVLVKSTANILLEWLHVKTHSVYDMDIGLRCKNEEEFAIEITEEDFSISFDGNALDVRGRKGGGRVLSGDWCLDRDFNRSALVARVCTSDCSKYGAFCLRKCCPLGQHYKPLRCGSFRSICVPDENQDQERFDLSTYLEDLNNDYDDLVDVIGMGVSITCPYGKFGLNKSQETDEHWLTSDGKLVGRRFKYDKFCLDSFDFRDCPENSFEISALGCFFPGDESKNFQFAAVTNTLSAVFLLITVLVYSCLPELQNLHGRTVICHSSIMLVAYSCLARVQFAKVDDPLLCKFLGYGIYFGFVAAFFWLNVMCFDIWWTFGNMRSVQVLRKSSSERRRFLWYSLYAWGITMLLTLVMYLLDTYHVSDLLDANMGRNYCWFSTEQNMKNDWPHYIFFVVPMGIVTSVNLLLWVLTSRHCSRVKSEVHRLQAGSVGDRAKKRFRLDRAKYLLTGKLWVVMGAGWISELLSTVFTEPPWLWAVVDLINQLQGVFIFLLLVFKPKVYYLIKKRLGLVKPDAQKNGASSGRTSSTFLSRTISSDERATLKTSLPDTDAKRA